MAPGNSPRTMRRTISVVIALVIRAMKIIPVCYFPRQLLNLDSKYRATFTGLLGLFI